mmetsp:Transcript_436/g.796  ORF Transcript_436/g.796 Transcript_436/m.796 type:complete len:186 (+) Transcript_436:2107-2664(+)
MGSRRGGPIEVRSDTPVRFVGRRGGVGSEADGGERRRRRGYDPRFEEACGVLNPEGFRKSYGFLEELREAELGRARLAVKRERNQARKEELALELQREEDREAERKRRVAVGDMKRAVKREEREKVRGGKKPYFRKRSEWKELELRAKYEQLKTTGGVTKYLERRRKKVAAKDRKLIPRARTEER